MPSFVGHASALTTVTFALAALTGACDRGDFGRGAQTTTTSSSSLTPQPDATVNTSHTIDNAGFVDNGGRTSDQTSRSEMSGMRATESGSDRPTGSPGEGLPLPIEPRVARPARRDDERERTRLASSPALEAATGPAKASGDVAVDAIARVARAQCDRETSCNRVGANRPWKTQDSCLEKHRESARTQLAALACARGFDSAQLGGCLNDLRGQACDVRSNLDSLDGCAASTICAR